MTDTKAIADHTSADKIKEAKSALRGATSHAATIIQANSDQGNVMRQAATILRLVAEEMGGVTIMFPKGPHRERSATSVKDILRGQADTLLNGVTE